MRHFGLLLCLFLLPVTLQAQEPVVEFDFYEHGPYRPEVPRPAEILGYEPGAFHTDYGNMLRVVRAIADAAADRVRLLEYGRSVEGRPLLLLAVSAPQNMERLGGIRDRIARLRDPRATDPEQAATIAENTPAIAWLNYANDGDETAAFEAAMQVAYQLAAGRDSATGEVLRDVVTVITPAHNPESHERFVAWYNAVATADSSRIALEHDAPWGLNTNNNHYQIDLNRDALGITQRETRALVAEYGRWNPQVFVDHHGQTEQYYMPPPMRPINPSLPADAVVKWTEIYGRANGSAFDRYGWNYYVRDIFDLHYPGYWDSWPSLNGATGMTYETDGGGTKGYRWRRDDNTVVSLRDGIAKHFIASLATLRATARHREERLSDFYDFFRSGMNEFTEGRPWRRFVIEAGPDPERSARLVELLLRNGIEVQVTTERVRLDEAHDYVTGETGTREIAPGSFVIDLAQPQARLVDALLAPDAEIDSIFLREQMQKRAINARRGDGATKQRYEFYDITAWSLPLSFGVRAWWSERAPAIPGRPVGAEFDGRSEPWGPPAFAPVRSLADLPPPLREGIPAGVEGGRAGTAYLFRYDRNGAARLAIALMEEGFNVAIATRPLRADGVTHPRGTFVLRVNRNPERLHDRMENLSRQFGVPVRAVHSAYTDEGDTGVGSEAVVTLRTPRVVVIGGGPVSERGYGHAWYTLERELGLYFTALRAECLPSLTGRASSYGGPTRVRLEDFDVIVLPPGSPEGYRRAFGDAGADRLREWVRSGGVLVGLAGGARYLADPELEFTTARRVGSEAEEDHAGEGGAEGDEDPASTEPHMPNARGIDLPPLPPRTAGEAAPIPVPGAILRATPDLTHPLTLGYESEAIPVLVSGADFYHPSSDGSSPVAFVGPELHVSGFVWPQNTESYLRDTAWMVDEPLGSGRVILFADDPNFRLIWPSLTRLFLNAILLAPTVR